MRALLTRNNMLKNADRAMKMVQERREDEEDGDEEDDEVDEDDGDDEGRRRGDEDDKGLQHGLRELEVAAGRGLDKLGFGVGMGMAKIMPKMMI
jgi:hypothetical protein